MNCSGDSIKAQGSFHLIQLAIYIPVFCFGVLFNALALWVFCCKLTKWTETRVYMINLVAADCSLLFILPFKVLTHGRNQMPNYVCLVVESTYFINRFASICFITIIALDRYVAIMYPIKSLTLRSPLKAASISGVLWVLVISCVCLTELLEDQENNRVCFEKLSTVPSKASLAFSIVGFFIPLIILSFCSIQIIKKLLRKMSRNPEENQLTRKAIYIVSANMVVFIICFLPVYTGHIVRFIVDATSADCSVIYMSNEFLHLASIIANTNCCLDAICYYFVTQEFQAASFLLQKTKSVKLMSSHD